MILAIYSCLLLHIGFFFAKAVQRMFGVFTNDAFHTASPSHPYPQLRRSFILNCPPLTPGTACVPKSA